MLFLVLISSANAVDISGCSDLSANTHYTLTTSITDYSSGTCMNVLGENVVLDCQGYTIDGIDSWSSYGLYTAFSNTTVKNCIFTDWMIGVQFDSGANNGAIQDVVANSNSWKGIDIYDADFITLETVTANDNNDYGIVMVSSYSSTIYNAIANNNPDTGILIDESHYTALEMITANYNEYGVYLENSDFCTIDNVVTNNNGDTGIVSDGNNNTMQNVTANGNGFSGIIIGWADNNNILQNVTANSNAEYGIWLSTSDSNTLETITANDNILSGIILEESNDNTIKDSVVNRSIQYDLYIDRNSDITALNTTYDTTYFGDLASSLTRQWYFNLLIRDQHNTLVEDVNVTIKDAFGTQLFSGLTVSDGTIQRQALTQYVQNSAGTTDYTPYNISLRKSGYTDNDTTIIFDGSKYLVMRFRAEAVDTDGDGLTDDEENAGWTITVYNCDGTAKYIIHVTSDPNIADKDGDGLNDYEEKQGWHVSYVWNSLPVEYDVSSHPNYADIDIDRLNDNQEKTAGTDPNRKNTDCDGAWDTDDGFEVDYGMNPLNSDTDDDGITDGEEIDMWVEEAGYDPSQPEEVPPEVVADATVNAKNTDVDGDGVLDGEDACPNIIGKVEYQGCPVGDENLVEMHIIDRLKTTCNGAGSCKLPIEGALVKVFDRNDADFQNLYTKNPSGLQYDEIFESSVGKIGSCTTNNDGRCVSGEKTAGDYLVIIKYVDEETGKMVYSGKPKSSRDFEDTDEDGIGDLAFKDFQIIKVINKDGTIDFKAGSKTVITGSMLEVIHPQYTIWESQQELYPFIFTSDSDWEVDVCVYVPEGYVVVGGDCTQVFVSGETKDIIFTVVETNSPPPNIKTSIKTKHNGGTKKLSLDIPGDWKDKKEKDKPKKTPFVLAGIFGTFTTVSFYKKRKDIFKAKFNNRL